MTHLITQHVRTPINKEFPSYLYNHAELNPCKTYLITHAWPSGNPKVYRFIIQVFAVERQFRSVRIKPECKAALELWEIPSGDPKVHLQGTFPRSNKDHRMPLPTLIIRSRAELSRVTWGFFSWSFCHVSGGSWASTPRYNCHRKCPSCSKVNLLKGNMSAVASGHTG